MSVRLLLAGLLLGAPLLCAAAASAATLAAHRATYDLSLDHVQGGGIVAATGHMTYQVTDTCTGWATQQQLRLQTVTRDGGPSTLVSDYATLESKDGRHLTFDMRQRANGATSEQVRGEATMPAAGAGSIGYTLPQRATVALPPGTLFPMAHTLAILQAAQAGRKSIAPLLFDGTGPDGAQDTYVVITGWQPPPSHSDRPLLAALGSAQVHVAFFSRAAGTISPDYEASMRYFSNGVSDRVLMDFGSFTMKAVMQDFVPAAPAHC
ncbi:cell envelope integrity EipB family protein [Lichenicoccus sp.]|uniref:cell envelope integrity EipB family protein n=1 Tax=Lichenicoccus sp. TaxID=2781899 RepID=UPI003D147642